MAYKIPMDKKVEVIQHLDFREKNGYERHTVEFYPYQGVIENVELQSPVTQQIPCFPISIYVATKDNESFAGPTDMQQLATQIYGAVGPSGPNTEYVYRLADAMRTLFPGEIDEHLFELEAALKNMNSKS